MAASRVRGVHTYLFLKTTPCRYSLWTASCLYTAVWTHLCTHNGKLNQVCTQHWDPALDTMCRRNSPEQKGSAARGELPCNVHGKLWPLLWAGFRGEVQPESTCGHKVLWILFACWLLLKTNELTCVQINYYSELSMQLCAGKFIVTAKTLYSSQLPVLRLFSTKRNTFKYYANSSANKYLVDISGKSLIWNSPSSGFMELVKKHPGKYGKIHISQEWVRQQAKCWHFYTKAMTDVTNKHRFIHE